MPNKVIKKFPKWGPEFKIEIDLKLNPTSAGGIFNIFRFTNTENDIDGKGDRIPALFYDDDNEILSFFTQINDDYSFAADFEVELDIVYKIVIRQFFDENGGNVFEILVNENLILNEINGIPETYENVKLLRDEFYKDESYGAILKMNIFNGNEKCFKAFTTYEDFENCK